MLPRARKIDTSSPVSAYKWIDRVNPDGCIDMHRCGNNQLRNAWVWNGPFHHKLPGAVDGTKADYNMDMLMGALLGHYGVTSPEKAVVFSHSHDEVGNAGGDGLSRGGTLILKKVG